MSPPSLSSFTPFPAWVSVSSSWQLLAVTTELVVVLAIAASSAWRTLGEPSCIPWAVDWCSRRSLRWSAVCSQAWAELPWSLLLWRVLWVHWNGRSIQNMYQLFFTYCALLANPERTAITATRRNRKLHLRCILISARTIEQIHRCLVDCKPVTGADLQLVWCFISPPTPYT